MRLIGSHSPRMLVGIVMVLGIGAIFPLLSCAQNLPRTAYEHRALYLYNFAKFTEWPKECFPDDSSPFVLGILGKDPFGKDIDIIKGKPIKNRKLAVKYFASVQEVEGCHLLFVSSSELNRLSDVLRALEKSSVLTITEVDGLVEHGGMINLLVENKTLGFDIDLAAAEKANLKLDTQLLRLAKSVRN